MNIVSSRAVGVRSIVLRGLAFLAVMAAMSTASFGQFRVAVTFGPPALPVYEQPLCPGEGYIWTPGYWSFDDEIDDYYWVPGTWVQAPEVGYLWTPSWWGWGSGGYLFHEGYWGSQVGFYGGINYGFGYFGDGYEGGRWDNGRFFYNRSVTNVNVTEIHNVYNTTVINNRTTINRVSYNGGSGGIEARPTAQQEAAARVRHIAPVAVQAEHVRAARGNPELRASVNQGRPPVAATARPGDFKGRAVVPAREAGAPYHPPANRGAGQQNRPSQDNRPANRLENNRPANNRPINNRPENNGSRPGNVVHPRDIPSADRPPSSNSGNSRLDQKYQKQQQKVDTRQERERQKLQSRQDREHQRVERQQAPPARTQKLEQKHQQQTQQLQQKHENQQQRMQQRQQPARPSEPKPSKDKKNQFRHN